MRRVVTGIDADGHHVITSDGPPPNSISTDALGVSEVLWADGPRLSISDDPDRDSPGFPLEPPPGGLSVRVIRMPGAPPASDPDDTWLRVDSEEPDAPGMHATDTLDLMVVLDGSVVLDLGDVELTVSAGEVVIQRGTRHRWRPADAHGWTYMVAMLRPDRAAADSESAPTVSPPRAGDRPVRRIVTGQPTLEGGAAVAVGGAHTTLTDLWQSGGPLRRPDQGGDIGTLADGWSLEPVGAGVAFRLVELSPELPLMQESWHTTATVDVDVMLSGRVRLELPGGSSTMLEPGDVVVQRGTSHRWVALGDEPLCMATVMIAAAETTEP